jgi:imidazolonepropionase-like amidohydrolase
MSFKHLFFMASLFCLVANAISQEVPVPASEQSKPIVIRGATIHVGNGQVIQNGVVAFDKGKITAVENSTSNRQFPNHEVIEASGMQLYPGFIAPNTQLGLIEIGAVNATVDNSETGELNPNIRSIISYNTDSEIIPTVRSMGILLAQITPSGGLIPGMSSVVQLDAWNWEDAAYATDIAMHLEWPTMMRFSRFNFQMERNENYDRQLQELESFFRQAQAYQPKGQGDNRNLRFESMKGLFNGTRKLFIHTNNAPSIQEAVLFAKKFNITPVIVGGNEAWLITDFLKANNVPVILESTQRLPSRTDEDVDLPFKTPALLQKAGILYCFGHEGFWQNRNLAFQAGQAVPFGLSYEQAVQGLTLNTAKILGIDNLAGSVEVGKDANLFLSKGDALDMRTALVTSAWIQGRKIDLDNKQEMLYRKFQQKYKK